MKFSSLSVLTCLLLALGVTACNDDDAVPQEEFFVSANQDGQAWYKGGKGSYLKESGEFYIYSPDTIPYAQTEVVTLRFILPRGRALTSVRPVSVGRTLLLGRDVGSNDYQTTDSIGLPSITITQLDTVKKIVEGNFEATLRRDDRYPQGALLMRFTNDAFRVHYKERP